MKLTISASSILVFQGFFAFAIGNVFVINRNRPSGLNQWWRSRDSFKVPTSICNRTSTGSDICGSFDANNGEESCSCSCPRDRATFVFADGWTCLENGKVRKLQGCKNINIFLAEKFNPRGPLYALNEADKYKVPTNIPFGRNYGWQTCNVHLNSTWYLGCDGARHDSSQYLSKMKEVFTFTRGSRIFRDYFVLQIKRGDTQLLQGRIINLGIQCTNTNQNQYQGCLMFKLMGQQTCSITVKPTTVSSSTISVRSAASPSQSTTKIVFPSNVRPRPSSGRERSTDEGSSSVGLIAGVTVGTVALAVFIVGFLIYRRRHSNNTTHSSKASSKGKNKQDTVMTMKPKTKSAYQRNDENEYKVEETQNYASTYCVPQYPAANDGPDSGQFYAPLNIQEGHNIYESKNTKEPFYHVLEKPTADNGTPSQKHDGSVSFEQPVYNIMEELLTTEATEGPVHYAVEPEYNVLEDPHLADTRGSGHYGTISSEGPIYKSLEGPYCHDPYYNKLTYNVECTSEPSYYPVEESTCSNISGADKHAGNRDVQDPVYNVLEGPE